MSRFEKLAGEIMDQGVSPEQLGTWLNDVTLEVDGHMSRELRQEFRNRRQRARVQLRARRGGSELIRLEERQVARARKTARKLFGLA